VRLYDYAASGNCYKARLLLALLDAPYERVPIDIFAGETLTSDFQAINPAQETPVLRLDDGAVITQSNAILWYLAEQTPFLPIDRIGRAQVVHWLMFEMEYIGRGVGSARFWTMTGRGDPASIAAHIELGRRGLARFEAHLRDADYLVDSLSLTDIAVFAYTHRAEDAGVPLAEFPHVGAWCRRIEEHPRFVDDFVPYPPNALAGAGRSIYD
jgi:glutathione S-transferase